MPGETVTLRAMNSGLGTYEIVRGSGVLKRVTRLPAGGIAAAWYAVGPWREHEQSVGEGTADEILLARFGTDLVEQAHETVLPLLSRPAGRDDAGLAIALRGLRERVHAQLDALGVNLGTDGPADVIVTRPGAESTSFNYRERRYMGLHVDQHDGLPLGRRGQARLAAPGECRLAPSLRVRVPLSRCGSMPGNRRCHRRRRPGSPVTRSHGPLFRRSPGCGNTSNPHRAWLRLPP